MTTSKKNPHAILEDDTPVAVLGAGPFARAVASLVAMTGRPLRIWARDATQRDELDALLPLAHVTSSLEDAVKGARFIVFGVPADAVAEVAMQYGEFARGDHVVLHGIRGFSPQCQLAHRAIRAQTRVRLVAALGGPLYFDDLSSGRPLVAVVASRFAEAHQAVRDVTAGTPVRVHTSNDIAGVEIAGAVSNVTHLAVGMCDALNMGETAHGLLVTHGFADAERLGKLFGASPSTFSGLAGIGDLIPRSVRSTERHHTVGAMLATGGSLRKGLALADGCVEGVDSARFASEYAARMKVKLPLVDAVAKILDGAPAEATLEEVLSRDILIGAENFRERGAY